MTTLKINKQLCGVCRCMVNPDGHEARCAVVDTRGKVDESVRRQAWLGDAVNLLDVRVVALMMQIPYSSLESFCQTYTSNEAMRDYMHTLEPGVVGSAARLGTVFESRYCGEFRRNYLYSVFPLYADRVLECVNVKWESVFKSD